jgi:hypothetical protein
MHRIKILAVLLAWLAMMSAVVAYWLTHLDRWDGTPDNDPRFGWPLYVLLAVIGLALFARHRLQLRRQARRKQRLNDLLQAAACQQQQGDSHEANRLLDEYRDLFIQLYGRSPEEGLLPRGG